MNQSLPNEEQIFRIARVIPSPAERSDYLKQVCGDNSQLFERMVALLNTTDEENSFLEVPPEALASTRCVPGLVTEKPGAEIGPYKLLQQIGEGGFGVVYMAEQLRPVKRKVALKIIKPGMDSKEVIARFEAERQALALMDHPNIAKVFDGGTTNSGRPYFVMELVKGVALTEFCDKNRLTTQQRLKLFANVCKAIQHAHQKGVIHRDIKPSNVMVTLNDNQPVPKVIDFGVAKAISQELTEKTMFTTYGQMIGTPQYMSPEQAQMSGLDIDTRSDVYSLGVLLYELLTGKTPLDVKQLRNTAYAEMQRLICEVEPSKPSTKITSLGKASMAIAQNRGIDARKLNLLLRGDLDWIVMTALDKDRNRRYESAGIFAGDIERYLADKPIQARPPSTTYRIQKFIRRNRGKVYGWSGAVVLLVVATIAIVSMVSKDRNNRLALDKIESEKAHAANALDSERRKRVTERRERAVEDARGAFLRMDYNSLRHSLKIADAAGASNEWMEILKGRVALLDGEVQDAIEHFESAISFDETGVAPRANLAKAYWALGKTSISLRLTNELDAYEARTADDYLFKGEAYADSEYKFLPQAVEALDEAIKRHRSVYGLVTRANTRAQCAQFITGDTRMYDEAFDDIQAALEFTSDRNVFAELHYDLLLNSAFFYRSLGETNKADDKYREAQEMKEAHRDLELEDVFQYANKSAEGLRRLFEAWRESIKRGGMTAHHVAMFSVQVGDQEAREVLEQLRDVSNGTGSPEVDGAIGFLLVVLDKKRLARQRLQSCLVENRGELDPGFSLMLLGVATLAGDLTFVQDQCEQLEKTEGLYAFQALGFEVLKGAAGYEDVMNEAKNDRTSRFENLVLLGFLRISQGEKAEAQRILEEVVKMESHRFYFGYLQAQAILHKLDDPDWYDNYIDDIGNH